MFSPELRETAREIGLFIFRVAVGAFMIAGHGYGKWMDFTEKAESFRDPIGLGAEWSLTLTVGAEFFCAALVVIGLATRIACIPLVIAMSVAAFVAHGGEPFGEKEMALLYGVSFLFLMLAGPGKLSIDGIISFLRRDT